MSIGAIFLLVLVALVVIAAASFFRNMLAGLLVLVGLPFAILLNALAGSLATISAVAAVVILAALMHTIADTLRLVRAAKRIRREPQSRARRSAPNTDSNRSRIAA
jgi:ABC-type transport system involved in cytochrome bd biosynthesis fused ATPase/permease subunit